MSTYGAPFDPSSVTFEPASEYSAPTRPSFDGIRRLVFLDRYALKHPIVPSDLKPGALGVASVEGGGRVVVELVRLDGEGRGEVRSIDSGQSWVVDLREVDWVIEKSPEDTWQRMADAQAEHEIRSNPKTKEKDEWARCYRWLLSDFRFVPGGRIWAMLGTGLERTAYNCLAGETIVMTEQGPRPIAELSGAVRVVSQDGVIREAHFRCYGVDRLWRIELENGQVIHATANHRWPYIARSGKIEWTTTEQLVGKRLIVTPVRRLFDEQLVQEGIQHGIVFGDGTIQRRKHRRDDGTVLLFGKKKELAATFVSSRPWEHYQGRYVGVAGLPTEWKSLPSDDRPLDYWYGFFVGLLATDGNVDTRGVVMLAQRDRAVLESLASKLHQMGIATLPIRYVDRPNPFNGEPSGYYVMRIPRSSLQVSDFIRSDQLANFLGAGLPQRRATIKVVAVMPTDRVEPVYCCEEPETHSFVIEGGLLTGNCYVIPLTESDGSSRDSRKAILDTLATMVEVMARGGGVGINLGTLRPRNSRVRGVEGRSSGSVAWGEIYSFATGLVSQGGSRRGALMLMLPVWHPDIFDFITAKKDMKRLTHANISVILTDAFEQALREDGTFDLEFPDYEAVAPEIYNAEWDGDLAKWKAKGYPTRVYQTVRARDLWHTIIESAWASAEPGIWRGDYSNRMSNSWYFHTLIATNPCGEQGLPPWGVCNLGHLNLPRFLEVVGQDDEGPLYEVQWEALAKATHLAVRFLDNVIDITPYFFEQNEQVQKSERRIGLGTMGLGETLIRLRLRYGSEASLAFIERLYRFIRDEAYKASIALAKEKGAFPAFDAEKFLQSAFMQTMPEELREAIRQYGIRNVTLLTQAPTGSTGTMAGTSTGIEPYYQFIYTRKGELGSHVVVEPVALDMGWYDAEGTKRKELPSYAVTAMDLTPEEHVRVQAAVQKYTDASISKTVNAPADYTVEDTEKLYNLALELGCKGITIYRDRSRNEQVLSRVEEKPVKKPCSSCPEPASSSSTATLSSVSVSTSSLSYPFTFETVTSPHIHVDLKELERIEQDARAWVERMSHPPVHRPDVVRGITEKIDTPLGKLYVTVNHDDQGRIIEVFIRGPAVKRPHDRQPDAVVAQDELDKALLELDAMTQALGMVLSEALKWGADPARLAAQLTAAKGNIFWHKSDHAPKGRLYRSLLDAVAGVLYRSLAEHPKTNPPSTPGPFTLTVTPATAFDADFKSDVNWQVVYQQVMPASQTAASATNGRAGRESPRCPNCGGDLRYEDCWTCPSCGWSKCG